MSYILDALKRADAERERGQVPGLHTHNMQPGAPARPHPGRPAAAWPLTAVAAAALGGAAWWWQTAPAPSAGAALPNPVAAPVSAESTPPAPIAADPSPEPQVPATASSAPPPAVLPLLAPAPPAPPSQPARAEATRPAAGTPTDTRSATDTHTAPKSPAETPTTSPVRSFAELSPQARAQLPLVNVNGATYSQNPAHRMLIANGKVVQEGQEVAPGLVLETIGPSSAVLNHRGLRYSIRY